MEVILRENITALGKIGDIVRVKDGYARNFLFPQRLAYQASEANKKRLEAERKALEAKEDGLRSQAEQLAEQIERVVVTITKEVSEEDKLYGSVTASDIADELEKQGVTVDRRTVSLGNPIKTTGEHEVKIRIHADVAAKCKVIVEGHSAKE